MRNARRSDDPSVERLRWMLIAAITGAAAAVPACAGKSQSTGTGGESGEGAGGSSATGGSGGKGGSGAVGGTGASGGTGGKGVGASGGVGGGGGVGGVITPPGGAGGSFGGKSGSGGSATGGSAGRQPDPEGCGAATAHSPTLWSCNGGFVHRPVPGVCPVPEDDGADVGEGGAANFPAAGCEIDAHCNDAPNGRCVVDNPLPEPVTSIYCVYACTGDADCGEGQVCSCESSFVSNATGSAITIGVCRPGSCGSDGECAANSLCISPVYSFCGTPRPSEYHCQTPEDECSGSGDCGGVDYCAYQGDHFACLGRPACGRPFLIDGTERQAPLAHGRDWAETLPAIGGVGALTEEQRGAVARHFAEAALMEHASIAAFARFSLQLLALGAPSDLVMETARAIADETRHARLCFGLAERYGLRGAAPGKLDVTGALGDVDLLDVVEMVTLEGCIGESSAALEAAWAAEAATDPVVRDALAGIAEDEARHAALAFKFVAWAAARDARVLPRVRALVTAAQATNGVETERAAGEVLEAHGVLDAATRRAARAAALRDVIPAAVSGIARAGALPVALEVA